MNIILDIGNVIFEWNPKQLVSHIFCKAEEQKEALNSIIAQEDWLDLDRGIIELSTAIENTTARCSLDPQKIAALYQAVPEHLTPIPSMVQAIEQAAEAKVPLYVLSNMPQHAWDYLASHYSFWKHFTGIVVSCEIHCIKPEPAIYAYVTETYQLNPQETWFLDDMAENVEAARKFGMHSERISDPHQGADVLRQVLQSSM